MCGGMVGGLLGLGGGFILGPLFLEMVIPPQVITALLKFQNAVWFIMNCFQCPWLRYLLLFR